MGAQSLDIEAFLTNK